MGRYHRLRVGVGEGGAYRGERHVQYDDEREPQQRGDLGLLLRR